MSSDLLPPEDRIAALTAAGRPIHPHMSVAFKGVNTQRRGNALADREHREG